MDPSITGAHASPMLLGGAAIVCAPHSTNPLLIAPHQTQPRASRRVVAMAARKKKMVALHGKGGTAASFEEYMWPLVEATSDTWE